MLGTKGHGNESHTRGSAQGEQGLQPGTVWGEELWGKSIPRGEAAKPLPQAVQREAIILDKRFLPLF